MSAVPPTTMSDEKKDPATLDVQEDVKLNSPEGGLATESHDPAVDCLDRDPNSINDHVKVRFSDIFAEPDEEVHSFDKIWVLSFKVFTLVKVWCYRITSVILALPCAVCWGCHFACLSFCQIWCCIPCLKACDVDLWCVRKIWTVCIDSFIGPCCAAYGLIFSRFNVKMAKEVV